MMPNCGCAIKRIIKNLLPDLLFLKREFRIRMGYSLNLRNPRTFNEKLNWLKLYDRKPIYTTLVDKYAVKKWVADKIGEKYIIPTLGVWESVEEIPFSELPSQFVLKCTHDSGGLVVCKDKSTLDFSAAKKKLQDSLKKNFYYQSREWPYKNVIPRIIAEKYMEDSGTEELRDYKFFCFDGKMRAMFIASDRQKKFEETKFDFFDRDFNHLPITNGHPNALNVPNKPKSFDEMIHLAEILSDGFPHVRVDFYEVDGNVFFGEMTFSHWGGFMPFVPDEWNYTFGSWITLPSR